ncbi:MAG: hypothetical protein ACI4IQ_06100 [Eubacterium sp.]
MAVFGALFILEVVILFSFVVTSLFMFLPKKEELVHKIFFSLAIMLGILVTTVDATSLPSTCRPQIIIAWLGLVPSAIAIIAAVAKGRPTAFSKLLVMLTSVWGALGYYFLV